MRRLFLAVAFVSVLCLSSGRVQAGSITFTQEFTGVTGSIGATGFSNETVTFTATADTTNITSPFSGLYELSLATINYTLTGSVNGSGTLTSAGYVFDYQTNNAAGMGSNSGGDFYDLQNPAFGSYHLTTSIGPITNSINGGVGDSLGTNNGDLYLSSAVDRNFSATAVPASVASPEPATLGMLATAIVASAAYVLRRRKACAA